MRARIHGQWPPHCSCITRELFSQRQAKIEPQSILYSTLLYVKGYLDAAETL